MDHPFPEKANDHPPFQSFGMEGAAPGATDYAMRVLNTEDPFSNIGELTNFGAYARWCNSPNYLTDQQMFPNFCLSPRPVASTGSVAEDGLTFTNQYNSEISMVDEDVIEGSFVSRNKARFCDMDGQFPFAPNSSEDDFDLVRRDESTTHPNLKDNIGNSLIPRPSNLSLAEKMLRALNLFKEWSGEGILAQVWVPMKNGDRYILSTCEQPYLLDQKLSGYREVSRLFNFAMDSNPGSFLGLPGRVFSSKIPEWTSNVLYYNETEYLRMQYAVDHEVRGSIGLPIFENDMFGRSCCAVLELVTVKEKSNFDVEIENVCRALQAVNLRCKIPQRLYPQSHSENQRAALAEIRNVLHAVCHAHRLPVALTWIPCSHTEEPGFENNKRVLCIENTACYVNDDDMKGFVHACAEHFLEEGQGIVGKALQSNQPFFYPDVKEYHISEYPLVHHVRKFSLNAAVAIRLRSIQTGDNDYVLELFLPVNVKGCPEQQLLLNNLSSTMQRLCKSLRTVSDAELHEMERPLVKIQDVGLSRRGSEHSFISGDTNSSLECKTQIASESMNTTVEVDGSHEERTTGLNKQMGKKRSTTEKHVSLSVLQQYFSGSLKDAAKSLGVCPTTLKRICRQHGISRWPSRKINKVNRSLKKIQTVLDSVQGMEGTFRIDTSMGGLVPSGSVIQEFDSKRTDISPKSTATACTDTKTHFIEQECPTDVSKDSKTISLHLHSQQKSQSATLDVRQSWPASLTNFPWATSPILPPPSGERHNSIWTFDDTSSTPAPATEEAIEHNQPTSSGMTDSSNGSQSNSSPRSFEKDQRQNHKKEPTGYGDSGSKIIVKATYREDTVRFKFEPSCRCLKLYDEIGKRFNLQTGHFQLKYLDDEQEWVMLVSDSDLQECMEMLEYLGSRNVKLLVRDMPVAMGSSGGSNCFLGESC